mgnify:FL=1
MSLSEKLKALRNGRNIKQKDLENATGINRSTLSQYENGQIPPVEILAKLAVYYGVSVDWLLDLTDIPAIDGACIPGDVDQTGLDGLVQTAQRNYHVNPQLHGALYRMLGEMINYEQHGAPCGPDPVDAWVSFTANLSRALGAACARDYATLLDAADSAVLAGLRAVDMPRRMLEEERSADQQQSGPDLHQP